MVDTTFSLKESLSGEKAFYRQNRAEEMGASKAPNSPVYSYSDENKIWRVAKEIFIITIFAVGGYQCACSLVGKVSFLPKATPNLMLIAVPIGLYRLAHPTIGKLILPTATSNSSDIATRMRKEVALDEEWKVKRIAVTVDGYIIDAAIMGREATLANGRWILYSNGNGEFYEHRLLNHSFKEMLYRLEGNAIVFNYPGVGGSSGKPSRTAMAKAYRAMLNLLEDQEKGIGAREIIGYGYSMGGGVQGDALRSHELKRGIKYCFVKDRTFSDLSTTAAHLVGLRIVGLLVSLFGWNISSIRSSKDLKAPEIIMQTVSRTGSGYTDIAERPQLVVHDRIISAGASLAKNLLREKRQFVGKKYFMGIEENHHTPLYQPLPLVRKINEMLATID